MFLPGVPFPKNFSQIAKTILKRLFRVYAHIYHQHFSEVVKLREEAHLNTSFKHFIFFVQVRLQGLRRVFEIVGEISHGSSIPSPKKEKPADLAHYSLKVAKIH